MTIFRLFKPCHFFLPRIATRSFSHKPTFGPYSEKTYQLFREIKERQLAVFFCENSLEPRSLLSTVFCADIEHLEKVSKMKLHSAISDRIWDAISPAKLNLLNETYTRAIQDTLLKNCSEKEIEQMLDEYDKGRSISLELDPRLRKVYKLHKRAIDTVLRSRAENIRNSWLPELVRAAEKEGIQFRK